MSQNNNIFLDCGTHYGQGLKQFISMYNMDSSWDIHTFEANPVTYKHFLKKQYNLLNTFNISHYNLAIFINDSKVIIHQETPPNEDNSGMGSSIISLDSWNPWGGMLRENFKTSAEIEAINFSNFIKNSFNKNNYIIVKMDIEGAEYDVLESLIETEAIHYINDLYIEFHSRFFTNTNEIMNREQKIKSFLSKTPIKVFEWH